MREVVRWLFSNPHYKLLSFALAVMAWSYVQLEEETEAQVRARVDWMLPPGLMSVEPLPKTVSFTVRGTGADVRRARAKRLRLPVDVQSSGVGDQQVEFAAFRPEGLPEALTVLGCSPSAMTFTLDESAERKVAVLPTQVGEPADGYIVRSVTIEPSVVRVEGPRGVIAAMVDVKSRPIEVSGLSADQTVPVQLELPRSVRLLDVTNLQATVSVVPELERRSLTGVPVVVWQQEGWTVEPPTIDAMLEGPASLLANIRSEDVVAFVHLPDNPERPSYEALWGPKEGVRLRLLHGAGDAVEVIRVEPAKVEARQR